MNLKMLFVVATLFFVTTVSITFANNTVFNAESLSHHQKVIKPLQKETTPPKTNKTEVVKTDSKVS